MTVHVNPVQCQSPNPHRLTAMQFKRSIWKGAISFLVQLTVVGDDLEDRVAAPYATVLEEYADVFSLYLQDYLQNGKWPILFFWSQMTSRHLGQSIG